jgi:hypothetical protein
MNDGLKLRLIEQAPQGFAVSYVSFHKPIRRVLEMRARVPALRSGRVEVIEVVHDRHSPGIFTE